MLRFLTTILLFTSTFDAFSQHTLRGKVIDSQTGKALPFVNLIFNEKGQGLTTSLEGTFEISTQQRIEWLKLSYVGYEPRTVTVNPDNYKKSMIIGLEPVSYNLDEVVVTPGVNPAHRIIEAVYENREKNNPEQLSGFSYVSYNKMFFTFKQPKPDSLFKNDSVPNIDSLAIKLDQMKKKQHMFMMESVTQRDYLYPDRTNEKVLASRVSGLKDPFFVFLATQFQSFSFYPELITLAGKNFLNPISKNSKKRYLFILEDTLFTQQNDTLFVVSFRPLRNSNFDGLKGVMNINSNGYAVQSVIAEPTEGLSPIFNVKIQQRYEFIENKQWFPVELNTDIIYNMLNANAKDKKTGKEIKLEMVGVGKSYIKDIELGTNLKPRDFSHIELTFDPHASEQPEIFWQQYRNDSLTQQELRTYKVIDSIGKVANLDKRVQLIETLMTGKIPVKMLSLDLNQLLRYNQFEGIRTGLGLETNRKVSEIFTVGGYFAYGFKDEKSKYGGFGRITLSKRQQVSIEGRYHLDVREPGTTKFEKPFGLTNTEKLRDVNIYQMDYQEQYQALLNFRAFKDFTFKVIGQKNQFDLASGNYFIANTLDTISHFNTTEVGVEVKFVWKEKFMETPRGLIPLNSSFPVIWLNYYRGISALDGDFTYSKYELKATHNIPFKTIGKTTFTVSASMVDGDVAPSLLYFAPGNLDKYYLDADNTFGTMNLYEFVADRYACLFIRHDLGNNLIKTGSEKWKLKYYLVQNMAIGEYTKKPEHLFANPSPKTLSKGFFESGMVMNILLSSTFSAPGVGVFYRYGPNSSSDWKENFAFKLSVGYNF